MIITNSLDWTDIEIEINRMSLLVQAKYKRDINRITGNLYNMVQELSKLELKHRRTNTKNSLLACENKAAEINAVLNQFEKLHLMAMLSGDR